MKKSFIAMFFVMTAGFVHAQNTAAEQLAENIARKMKDSLSLTEQEKNHVYGINLLLSNQKTAVRQQYSAPDSLRYHLQRVENSRDSLYREILNEEKFLLYRQKKRNLINNN
jgi:hypothetical protein